MSEIRIIAVSLAGRKPLMAIATVTNTAVHFAEIKSLPESLAATEKELQKLQAMANKLNAELVVEDPTGLFGRFGMPIKLSLRGIDGRPVLVNAMDRYTALSSVGAITFPNGLEGRCRISSSLYNVRHTEGGGVSFEIDWDRMTDESRIMLLALYAGLCQTTFQKGFMSRFMSALGAQDEAERRPAPQGKQVNPLLNDGYML